MKPRVAVIGTGILGACVGWNLSRRGAEVIFVDLLAPGEGVTNWSFAWVNASAKTARRSYFDLSVAAMTTYGELVKTLGPGSWWHPTGHVRWTDDPAAESELLATAELLAGRNYRAEVWTGAEVRRCLESALVLPDEVAVVHYPDEAWVHGRRLVRRLVGEAVASGADHRSGTAVRAIELGHHPSVVLSDGTRLEVDAVVNAAGPGAAEVAGLVGRHLPMRREPGAVARLACERVPIERAMHTPHVEIRPDGDASVVLHSREVDALVDTDADLGQLLHTLAGAVVPELSEARVAAVRAVERPIPADTFPSVGAALAGYYEAVSHSGITLGPLLGRLLAAEILTGERDNLLADFRPERFG
ncbi:NAD(P)/FAD-dependent oxidoreductase [Kribbella sp. NPDC048928]|uniref:NAD(P)/FAD-dependent oxidoreductase n=1 Tax=Kribbella sp. NPDC048928 TaxID=3364111 RepID=UPI003712E24A